MEYRKELSGDPPNKAYQTSFLPALRVNKTAIGRTKTTYVSFQKPWAKAIQIISCLCSLFYLRSWTFQKACCCFPTHPFSFTALSDKMEDIWQINSNSEEGNDLAYNVLFLYLDTSSQTRLMLYWFLNCLWNDVVGKKNNTQGGGISPSTAPSLEKVGHQASYCEALWDC